VTKHLIFVYGTLKTGYWNYDRILKDRAEFVGVATSVDRDYKMYGSSIPFLTRDSETDGDYVSGEVFEVNEVTLVLCDRLEGHPDHYCREEREFLVADRRVTAWVYLVPPGRIFADPRWLPDDGLLTWSMFKVGDQVANAYSSIVGTVTDPSPKPGFVGVTFPGHGERGFPLRIDQIVEVSLVKLDEDEDYAEDDDGEAEL